MSNTVLIVGGNFGENPKKSSIVKNLGDLLKATDVINGGSELPETVSHDLVLWMPNISNESEKTYPIKRKGSVLICSKVMRDEYTRIDAVSRIFKMKGNAVIAIYKSEPLFMFELIDALGNVWVRTSDLETLRDHIFKFYKWTMDSIRLSSVEISKKDRVVCEDIENFLEINRKLSGNIQISTGNRFFGNISTRCSKLFPSTKCKDGAFMSPRNISKGDLKSGDMIFTKLENGIVKYLGDRKPSVDSPIQLSVYKENPNINFIIHGHAFVEKAYTTEHYYPCGDMREFDELKYVIGRKDSGIVNLKNHGFIIFSDTLDNLKTLIERSKFNYKRDGES